jgi:hypothetical protein
VIGRVNVAILSLARGVRRAQEIATRASLASFCRKTRKLLMQ